MKKVIKLTESDLVKIVKRVIKEQTENGPVAKPVKTIKVPTDFSKNIGIDFGKEETDKSFINKINDANVGVSGFYIQSQGWKFPIFPAYANIPTRKGNFRVSFEPLDPENGKYLLKWTKNF